ncbi:type VI secretion system Vgr family protein [Bordetella genomosp. 13]|uniref:type VI secretion system Vgr family protein n=1 Tax=Bordetella genomosp. 13 TaxID=463040 RepID=UPI0011A04898|nr:type VI secretion system tip protein TssI/VgrG [Bordetella genomosp. 13]
MDIPAAASAATHTLRVQIAGAPAGILFRAMEGEEQLSRLFEFQVDVLYEGMGLDLRSFLGKSLTLEIDTDEAGAGTRHLNGLITRFTLMGKETATQRYYQYRATVRPWLWSASRREDFRIFQEKNVPDIVEEVLKPYGHSIERKLVESYRPWNYCVQYGESDFDFVSRLLEHEGIYYWFKHSNGKHELVLADDMSAHEASPGCDSLPYYGAERQNMPDESYLSDLRVAEEVRSGEYVTDDYNFENPKASLAATQRQPAQHDEDAHQVYQWPGDYKDADHGQDYARVRMEELHQQREQSELRSNVRGLQTASVFSLRNCPRDSENRKYLVVGTRYRVSEGGYYTGGVPGAGFMPAVMSTSLASLNGAVPQPNADPRQGTVCEFDLTVQPATLAYRPPRVTRKPRTLGPQTAVVTGPAGEEIWTDQYGRVKVHFHWDRTGPRDENSSCWIRVSNPWASSGFGGIQVPRIGDEVVVDFMNGDPDAPLITGRVYNASNMPPWELPGNATQMGLMSRSTPQGDPNNANAIRFEDKMGAEQLWIHAERNQDIEVERDETHWVGQDRKKTIDRDETVNVKRDRTETVDRNETITVHGQRTETVDKDETITIHQNRKERVDLNEDVSIGVNQKHKVGSNRTRNVGVNETVTVGANRVQTVALGSMHNVGIAEVTTIGAGYMLNVGAAWNANIGFTMFENVGMMKKVNVGKMFSMDAGTSVSISAGKAITISTGKSSIQLESDGTITITGVKIKISGSEIVDLDGKVIDLN